MMTGVAIDISGHRQVEEDVRLSNERLVNLMKASPLPIIISDTECCLTSWNLAAERMFGWREEEVLGKFPPIIPKDKLDLFYKNFRRQLIGEPDVNGLELPACQKDGAGLIIKLFTSTVLNDAGETIGVVSILQDITELKKAEEALRASEERYRTTIMNNVTAMALNEMLYDSEGHPVDYRFLRVNSAFEKLTGLPPSRVEGKTVREVFPNLDHFWLETYAQVVAKGQPITFERYEGTLERHLQVSAFKTKDSQFTTIFAEVTEPKETKEGRLAVLVSAIQSIAAAIEVRDFYTSGHQRRVGNLASAIAREMGLDEERIKGIELGGLLHDIGKISVPAEILAKPGKINDLEKAIIRQHPQRGYEILKTMETPWPLKEMVQQHHERLDGSGYPSGLTEGEMVLEAKILAVADVVEAMASHRPYRPALGIDTALEEISKNQATLYDFKAVGACITLFKEKGFHF